MLVRGLAHEGVQAFARDYLHSAPFVGRGDERARLQAFGEGADRRALLTAPAGRGKSALALRWASDLDASGQRVVWVPISRRFGTFRSAAVEDLLTARLSVLVGSTEGWREVLRRHEGRPLVVVLDGLDELQDTGLIDALRGLETGASVKVLATARPVLGCDAEGWRARLGWSPCVMLDLGPLTGRDVTELLAPDAGADVARQVMARTGGDPLLVRLCHEALGRGEALPDVRDPAELLGAWWTEQRASLRAGQDGVAERALGALGAALGPVPWAVLAAVVGESEEDVRQALRPFGRFVTEAAGQGVTFGHPRFNELAAWMYPEATQRAQRGFAEQTLAARQTETADPYFLHFGLAHLDQVGASDEQRESLLNEASMQAWVRLEGSAFGLLGEAEDLLGRSARRLEEVWGTEAALQVLEAQARLYHQALRLRGTVKEIDSELEYELVRHGLRTPAEILQRTVGKPSGAGLSLHELLPVMPDSALPLIASAYPTRGFLALMSETLLARLFTAGLRQEAIDFLDACEITPGEGLARAAAGLPAEEKAFLFDRYAPGLRARGDQVSLRGWLHLLDLLPREQGDEELRQADARLQAQWPALRDDPGAKGQVAAPLLLIEAAARRGMDGIALHWLRELQAHDHVFARKAEPWSGLTHPGQLFAWSSYLQGPARKEALALVDAIVKRNPPPGGMMQAALTQGRIPEDHAGHAALWETLWSAGPHNHELYEIFQQPSLSPSNRERGVQVVMQGVRDAIAGQGGDASRAGLLGGLDSDALRDLLLEGLADPEQPDHVREDLKKSLILSATDEPARAAIRERLRDGSLEAGPWLWTYHNDNWLHVLPEDERRALLRENMQGAADTSMFQVEFERALRDIDPARESEAAGLLRSVIEEVAPTIVDPTHWLFYRATRALLPDEEVSSLALWVLPSKEQMDDEHALYRVNALLRTNDPRLDLETLARGALRALSTATLPLCPEEAEALARVPAPERRAWVERCCRQPEADAGDLTGWMRSRARWQQGELDELRPGAPREPVHVLPEVEPMRETPSLVAAQAARQLRRMPGAWRQDPSAGPLLSAALSGASAATLLDLAPLVPPLEDDFVTRRFIAQATKLWRRGGPDAAALEAAIVACLPPASEDPDEQSQWLNEKPEVWFWLNRSLSLTERVSAMLSSYGLVNFVDMGLHEEAMALLGKAIEEPARRLTTLAVLREQLASDGSHPARDAEVTSMTVGALDQAGAWGVFSWSSLERELMRVDDTSLRSVWGREIRRPRNEIAFPVEVLRRMGGSEAVNAWARGIAAVFETATEADRLTG